MSYDNTVDSVWKMCCKKETTIQEEEKKVTRNEKSVTNLIDCIHFYGVLPTLKIDINRKGNTPIHFGLLDVFHFVCSPYIVGMSLLLSSSFLQNIPCTWLEMKIRCWWCDALYRTYLLNISKVSVHASRWFFFLVLSHLVCQANSFYIPTISHLIFSHIIFFYALSQSFQNIIAPHIHHCQFTYFILILNFLILRKLGITSLVSYQKLVYRTGLLVTAYNPLIAFEALSSIFVFLFIFLNRFPWKLKLNSDCKSNLEGFGCD